MSKTSINPIQLLVVLALSFCALIAVTTAVSAAPILQETLSEEVNVGATPYHLVAEGPGRVWFTAPDNNLIGILVFTDTTDYQVMTFTVPTTASMPYDLVIAKDTIWFTEFSGNKLAKLNPLDGSIQEYELPSLNSGPKALAVAPDNTIWVVESATEKLAHFLPATQSFEEYSYRKQLFMPVIMGNQSTTSASTTALSFPDTGFEDIAIGSDNTIWLTWPAGNRMVYFSVVRHEFYDIPTTPFVKPTAVIVDESNIPWVIAQGSSSSTADQIGRYLPGTLSLWHWQALPSGGNQPAALFYRITATSREFWFTGSATGSAGRLVTAPNRVLLSRQAGLVHPDLPSQPNGIVADTNGDVWIALTNRPVIVHWRQPYFHDVYLPSVAKSIPVLTAK